MSDLEMRGAFRQVRPPEVCRRCAGTGNEPSEDRDMAELASWLLLISLGMLLSGTGGFLLGCWWR